MSSVNPCRRRQTGPGRGYRDERLGRGVCELTPWLTHIKTWLMPNSRPLAGIHYCRYTVYVIIENSSNGTNRLLLFIASNHRPTGGNTYSSKWTHAVQSLMDNGKWFLSNGLVFFFLPITRGFKTALKDITLTTWYLLSAFISRAFSQSLVWKVVICHFMPAPIRLIALDRLV